MSTSTSRFAPSCDDLAAELRADRAAAARHEYDPVADVGADRLEVDLDLLAAEHVLDRDRADLAREVDVAGDQLVQRRQRLHRHAFRARELDDLAAQLARRRRHRDQHLVRAVVADQVAQVVGRAEHADAVDAEVLLARVVVDEADRRVREQPVALHLAQDQLAGVAGADDQHLLAARDEPAARPLEQRAREEPRAGHEREQQQVVERDDPLRQMRACRAAGRRRARGRRRGTPTVTPRKARHMSRVETYRHQRL